MLQNNELQALTVVQLRKLAKEKGVKLGSGIDKEGIVTRLWQALGSDWKADEEKPADDSIAIPSSTAVKQSASQEEPVQAEKVQDKQQNIEKLQGAALSADVTSVQPGMGFRPWNQPQEPEGYKPAYRQAWQARSAGRDTQQKPAWQQPKRPVGSTVNRFGPQQTAPVQPLQQRSPQHAEMQQNRTSERTQSVHEQQSINPETAPKLDGYRLGYRAAPQRNTYQNRNEYSTRDQNYGGYQQSSYRNNNQQNYQSRGYQQSNYRPPNNNQSYPPRLPQQVPSEANYNDNLYRMGRDPQFAQQAEAGQVPDLLKVTEGEPAQGVLEILPDGYGFLRGRSLLPGKTDIYVSVAQIRRYHLRTGDFVEGKARPQRGGDKFAALLFVEKLNGVEAQENPDRLGFEQLVPVYPNERIVLESAEHQGSMAIRLVDLVAPIGFGQRAMIVAPPDSGRLLLLKEISAAIRFNDKNAEVLMLLIDVAPEDVTEISEAVEAEVFASTFADSPETQTRVSETMLERAQRLVEDGRNVVILLDSLTKLTRAYQASLVQGSRPVTNTVTPAALIRPKRFFGAARNTRDAGSLTMIATIAVETGSRVDDIIFEEFKGTANMEVVLCTRGENDPVYPMIDMQKSGTKKDDMLLTDEQKTALKSIRKVLASTTNGEAVAQLISMMQKTKCNADLLNRLHEWLALWEKSGYLKR